MGAEATGIGAEPAVSNSWPVALRAVRAWLIPWSVLALLAVVVTSTARASGDDPVDDLADPAEGIDEQLGAGHGGSCALPGAPQGAAGSSG